MLVVLSIILIVTGIVSTSRAGFEQTTLLANTAYDLALSIRSVQNYGIAGQVGAGTPSGVGHGVNIKKSANVITFADTHPTSSTCYKASVHGTSAPNARTGNCRYTSEDTVLQTLAFGNGVSVTDFCIFNSPTPGQWSCANARAGIAAGPISEVNVTFVRPNANVTITSDKGYLVGAQGVKACIELSSRQAKQRYIILNQSGLISPLPNGSSCMP